jgi:hypothetical protein
MCFLDVVMLSWLTQAPLTPGARLMQETTADEWVSQQLDDGRHYRFGTDGSGPVHVFVPRGVTAANADIVIYLHGFYTDVDEAVRSQSLFTQFRDSARKSIFIVPQTRSARGDALFFTQLPKLLFEVSRRTGLPLATQPITAVAHSGGYRLLVEWLNEPRLSKIILVDGLYGNEADFKRWLAGPSAGSRQLVLVGFDTQQRSERAMESIAPRVVLRQVPYLFDNVKPEWKTARLVSIQSERFDHMALIESGRLLPWLLRVF